MKISFRKAEKKDIEFLLILRNETMNEYLEQANVDTSQAYHLERITECFEDTHIILCNDHAIGLVKLGVLLRSVHIRQFQIQPNYQGKGIGTKVLAVVKRKAEKLELPITLNVLLNNPAMSLYLRNGFNKIKEAHFECQLIYRHKG